MESARFPDDTSGLPPLGSTQHDLPLRSAPLPSESLSSRQQRLLQNRKSRFSGSRLSITRLGGSLAKAVGDREQLRPRLNQLNRQENSPPSVIPETKSSPFQRSGTQTSKRDLILKNANTLSAAGTFDLHSPTDANATRDRVHSSPIIYHSVLNAPDSVTSSNSSLGEGDTMQLRELSGNEYRGALPRRVVMTATKKTTRKPNGALHRSSFDTENYIEHIENELQQAKQEMHSPTVNKSLQNQLKTAKLENERLKREISDIRSAFESEVKNMVEHKTALEVDLRRKVRDLEDDLERKAFTIKELEYHHEEKRLDNNTLESLKAAIEKLEKEKISIGDENKRMNKRNEVLSELLAMSPNKSHPAFELKSPVREKRPGRPMSMIIPRAPSSPTSGALNSNPTSVLTSPSLSVKTLPPLSTELEPFMLASSIDANSRQASSTVNLHDNKFLISESLMCTSPAPCSIPLPSSPRDDATTQSQMTRKPRKFMSGSTQLKPLLLPALTGDSSNPPSASVISSPGQPTSRLVDFESDSYFTPMNQDSGLQDRMSSDLQYIHATPTCVNELSRRRHNPDIDMIDIRNNLDDTLAYSRGRCFNSPTSLASVLNSSGEEADNIKTPDRSRMKRTPFRGCYDGQEDVESPEWSDSGKLSSGGLRRSFTFPANFNLDALGELELPEAHYDAFPSHVVSPDHSLWRAVPAPLFSPATRNARHSLHFSNAESKSRVRNTNSINAESSSPTSSQHCEASIGQKPPTLNEFSLAQATDSFVSMSRSRTPLDLLQHRNFGARPLAAVTIRTMFNTISRCTSLVRDFKQDPLGLARRLIHKAWIMNWARLGKLSWWVLGLFMAPKRQIEQTQWNWDDYDAEQIAEKYCGPDFCDSEAHNVRENYDQCGHGRNPNIHESIESASCDVEQPVQQEHRPGWGKSLWLWGKFSVAILLAVGGAVVKGPGEMLEEMDGKLTTKLDTRREKHHNRDPHHLKSVRRFSEGHASSQELFVRTQKARKRRDQCASLASQTRFGDMLVPGNDSRFPSPFVASQRTATHGTAHHRYEPIGDSTLRPLRGQRVHVEDVFTQGYNNDDDDVWNDQEPIAQPSAASSFHGSVSSGIFKWPPSPDLCPDDSVSQQS